MRVRGAEHDLLAIQTGDAVTDPPADLIENGGVDRDQITGHQDRLIDDLIAIPRFQGQGRRHHGAFHGSGDPGVHLPCKRDRPIGRDADGRPSHVQLSGPAFDDRAEQRKAGESPDRPQRSHQSNCWHSWCPPDDP